MQIVLAPVQTDPAVTGVERRVRLRQRLGRPACAPKPSGALGWLPLVAAGVLVAQLTFLVIWSLVEWNRFDLSYDFFVYFRSWHAFWAHSLDPFNRVADRLNLANNATLIVWPLAVLTRLFPHGIVLLLVQDLALVAAETVALSWMAEALVGGGLASSNPRLARSLFGLGIVLLVFNPWIYWSNAYDFHIEVIAVLFVLLATRELVRKRWLRMGLWVALTLSCGFVAATYVVGLALSALVMGGGRRVAGLVLLSGGALLVLLGALDTHLSGGFAAQFVSSYGFLAGPGVGVGGVGAADIARVVAGALAHPGRVLATLWSNRLAILANLAPSGLIGIALPCLLGIGVVGLATTELNRYTAFVAPGFQSLVIYVLVPLGTVLVLARLALRSRRGMELTWLLALLLGLDTLAWAFSALPPLPSRLLPVPRSTAAVLRRLDARIPPGADVFASFGIVGRFGDRRWVDPMAYPGPRPVHGRAVWFVVVPSRGSAAETAPAGLATVSELGGPLHAQLVVSGAGVWAFRWTPPRGVHSVTIPGVPSAAPAKGAAAANPGGGV